MFLVKSIIVEPTFARCCRAGRPGGRQPAGGIPSEPR